MPSERHWGVIGESAAALLSDPPKDGQSPDKARRRGRLIGYEINLQYK
ncbi:TPA: hypothetical protein WI803_000108 [Neisseria meningitidis]|nr:hypothetical protein [Neisseria meningitidis]